MINKKRGEWFLRDWLIAGLFFSGIMALMYIVSSDFLNMNGRPDLVDPNFAASYDKFTTNTNNIQSIFNSVNGEHGLDPFNFGQLLFKSSLTVFSLVFTSLTSFTSQINAIFVDLGVPTVISNIVGPLILGVIMVSLVFIILSRGKV